MTPPVLNVLKQHVGDIYSSWNLSYHFFSLRSPYPYQASWYKRNSKLLRKKFVRERKFWNPPPSSRHYITTSQNKVLSPEKRGEVTTQNGYGETKSVYFTKESIYLLKILHTFRTGPKSCPCRWQWISQYEHTKKYDVYSVGCLRSGTHVPLVTNYGFCVKGRWTVGFLPYDAIYN